MARLHLILDVQFIYLKYFYLIVLLKKDPRQLIQGNSIIIACWWFVLLSELVLFFGEMGHRPPNPSPLPSQWGTGTK